MIAEKVVDEASGNQFLIHKGFGRSHTMDSGNGTSNFDVVEAGTLMGQVTATNGVRPCARTTAQAATGTAIPVADADCFFIGDTISVESLLGVNGENQTLDADGAGNLIDLISKDRDGLAHAVVLESPTLGVLGSHEVIASGAGDVIDLKTVQADGLAHTVTLLDPSANDALLFGRSDIDASTGLETLIISLATGGAGAITSTVDDVIEEINASSHLQEAALHSGDTGSNTAIAVVSSAMASGVAAPDDKSLRGESVLAAATDLETLTIVLGLNEIGTAIASTVSEVIACINAASQKVEARIHSGDSGAGTAIAVASTALTGAVAVGGALLSSAAVTAVDKTSSPNTITTASSITTALGDVVEEDDGSGTAIGFLESSTSTFMREVDEDGDAVHQDRPVEIIMCGVVDESECIGTIDTHVKTDDLLNITFI